MSTELLFFDHYEKQDLQIIVGHGRGVVFLETLKRLRWGRMFVFEKPDPYEGEPWGFDNGAFVFWSKGQSFNEDLYKKNLDRAARLKSIPHLAVVPDIVAGGLKSLDFSLRWRDRMPEHWPLYLAVQDGMTIADIESVIKRFDGLFLGGSDSFKKTAPEWSRLAHEWGKKFHYGRAGTLKKLGLAKEAGADSLDSTSMIRTWGKVDAFVSRLNQADPQLALFAQSEAQQ